MKKLIRNILIVLIIVASVFVSFEPKKGLAAEDPNYEVNNTSADVSIDTPIYDNNGNLVDMQSGRQPGRIFNNQKNARATATGVEYVNRTTTGSYTYGAEGSVYAQSWQQITCNDPDAISNERVCPVGTTPLSNGKCQKNEVLTEVKTCPAGSVEDEDGICHQEVAGGDMTPTCDSLYTLNADRTQCTYTTYSCPEGFTPSGTGSSMRCSKTETTSPTTTQKTVTIDGNTYYMGNQTEQIKNSRLTAQSSNVSNNSTGYVIYKNNKNSNYYACLSSTYTYRTCYSLSRTATYTCPTNYTLSNNQCTKTTTQNANPTTTTRTPNCQSGYTLQGGTCKSTTVGAEVAKVCPSGYIESLTGICERIVNMEVEKSCKAGYRMTNGKCQKTNCQDFTVRNTHSDGSEEFGKDGDVEVKKSVEQTVNFKNTGIYKISFQARAKNFAMPEVYTVIVLDNSNSMNGVWINDGINSGNSNYVTCTVERGQTIGKTNKGGSKEGYTFTTGTACINDANYGVFVLNKNKYNSAIAGANLVSSTLQEIDTSHIALVSFGKNVEDVYNFTQNDLKINEPGSNYTIDVPVEEESSGNGSTNIYDGLTRALQIMNSTNIPENAFKNIILISDGAPTQPTKNGNSNYPREQAYAAANLIKNAGIELYTLGYEIDSDTTAQTVLKNISTNATTHYYSGDASTVSARLADIAARIKDLISTKIKDQIGMNFDFDAEGPKSNGFELVGQPVINNVKVLNETFQDLGYFYIKIDPETADGWYYTNNGFVFEYNDADGNPQSIECNDDPMVWWQQKTHNYTIEYYYDDGNGYVQHLDWSPNASESGIKLIKSGGEIQNTFGPTYDEVSGEIRTNNYNYELVAVKYHDITSGIDVTKNNNEYKMRMSEDDNENIIRVYYRKRKTLSVSKKLKSLNTGEYITNDKLTFKFKVEFNQKPLEGENFQYRYQSRTRNFTFEENEFYGYITIKAGESIGFINLPSDIEYSISEIDAESYIVEILFNGEEAREVTGKVLSESSNVEFTNIFGYELPETGSSLGLIIMIMAVLLFALPIINSIYNFNIDRRISWRLKKEII